MELQWPLIIFTTLLAWSCGVFAAQGALALKGEGKEVQLPALVTSVVLLAVSGVAVFFHLQHWERIFNGFGHITSGITQELIAIVVFVVVAVVYFAMLR
ncbi:MAG TPA: dimethyl sulfoxide reductase anchor subunit, partial [Candidatus Aveggerthella excrementigallinarum]|nr:dimethyl sulfoxide reductase anchor subunit [Candidatus Aveggerthella excrementigallinarum]